RCTDGGRAHVVSLLDGAEEHLVKPVGVSEEFVVIDLHDEGDLVSVLARHGAEHAIGRSNGVAAALDRQLDDILAIEIVRVLGETRAAGMLDALIHRKNGQVAGAVEAAIEEHTVKIVQHAEIAIGSRVDPVNKIGAGKMQPFLGNLGGLETQEGFRPCAQELFNCTGSCRCHGSLLNLVANSGCEQCSCGLVHQPKQLAVRRLNQLRRKLLRLIGSFQNRFQGRSLVSASDQKNYPVRLVDGGSGERDALRIEFSYPVANHNAIGRSVQSFRAREERKGVAFITHAEQDQIEARKRACSYYKVSAKRLL